MARRQPVTFGTLHFPDKKSALAHLKSLLGSYRPGDRVSDADEVVLREALQNHADAASKVGPGVDHFMVRSADFGTQCFWVVRTDGTTERFSYKRCVT